MRKKERGKGGRGEDWGANAIMGKLEKKKSTAGSLQKKR